MKTLFAHRWLISVAVTILAALVMLLGFGQLDLVVLMVVFVLSAIGLSYPSLQERLWQARHLPPDTIHVPVSRIRKPNNEFDLQQLFFQPQVFQWIKNRYALRTGDAGAPGLFLYIYLPSRVYENRNIGPETVYRQVAEKLKQELNDPSNIDLIAQRNLPLSFGYRFLNKNEFGQYEFSKSIDIIKKDYYRENTRIRGVLQSKRRMFRIHSPEDDEWRTFAPYQEAGQVLYGGELKTHDFRAQSPRRLRTDRLREVEAERVDYHEPVPFGSLLTYAKKGEISLKGAPEAVDKLYIDKLNVLVQGTEYRREILQAMGKMLGREFADEDFYGLFNYGQRLLGYLPAGKSLTDFVSSHGNFALYYDGDKGWTIYKLEPGLELRLHETFWSTEPRPVDGSRPLGTSRATLITGSADSQMELQISTGTPTRGQIFAADGIIENKIKTFAGLNRYRLIHELGSGAEGALFLAEKNGGRYYVKSPDGQLAVEEMETVEKLKKLGCIPQEIATFPEERIIVSPEYPSVPEVVDGNRQTAVALLFDYLKRVWSNGWLCLDLTPDHVRIAPAQKKLFLIDFSGYVEAARFSGQSARELLADRKKTEYRTPEESTGRLASPEKFQVYLMGLLIYQLLRDDRQLPLALQHLGDGPAAYQQRLDQDLQALSNSHAPVLNKMLHFEPADRNDFEALAPCFKLTQEKIEEFWNSVSPR